MHDAARVARGKSGPKVARLFGATLSLLWVAAWWSWALEAHLLIGEQGLVPLSETLDATRGSLSLGQAVAAAPSIFWLSASDWAQTAAIVLGLLSAAIAAAGFALRPMLALQVVLYGSFVAVGAPFLPLLGDKLLLECTLLALLLPRNEAWAPLHTLARLMLVKLYVEAGLHHLAGVQHVLGNVSLAPLVQAGPLPTWGGYVLGQLAPTLLGIGGIVLVTLELGVAWLALGPGRLPLVAGVVLTSLQLGGALMFNSGLFAFAAVALHLFCLREADVDTFVGDLAPPSSALGRALRHLLRPRMSPRPPPRWAGPTRVLRTAALAVWLGLGALQQLPGELGASLFEGTKPLLGFIPSYGYATHQARLVPVFEVLPGVQEAQGRGQSSQGPWQPLGLWHLPGDVALAPQLIAPHAPRLDLALANWGQHAAQRPSPQLVQHLMAQICRAPAQLGRLVRPHAWHHPQAVRWRLFHYRFAHRREHRRSGAFWQRTLVAEGETLRCAPLQRDSTER